jgi:hypothetical protein
MIKDRNIALDAAINPSKILGSGLTGAGNIFYAAVSGTAMYTYLNGKVANANLVTDIQSALDLTTANQNDYVIVSPSTSDYDLTAALTMSKARTHLICPAGVGNFGMNNFARIHQTTATTQNIVVTADCVEIAGLFFKGYDSTGYDAPSIIHLSGTRWTPNIHDNFFGLGATAAGAGYGILADGACSHFNIHDNYFTNYAPGAVTGTDNAIAAFIGITSGSSTRGIIDNNIIHTGANTTVTSGINCQAAYAIIQNNMLVADQAVGSSQAGVMTTGITGVVSTVTRYNTFHNVTGTYSGTTVDASNVHNYYGLNGGTLADEDIG